MKRFSKLLALGLAAALMFGMTAQAAVSVTTQGVEVESAPEGVTVDNIDAATESSAKTTVSGMVAEAAKQTGLNKEFVETQKFVAAFELEGIGKDDVATVTFKVPAVVKDHRYLVYHLKANGEWEVIRVKATADGSLTATFHGASPVLVYEYTQGEPDAPRDNGQAGAGTSPKTGEAVPVAGMMALVLLAGAALCAGKARYNR